MPATPFFKQAALRIGTVDFANRLALAPMAGVADLPFRLLCRRFGAAITPAEMVTADTRLWDTRKSRLRLDHRGDPGPRIVQIAGADPKELAAAAQRAVDHGAHIVDLNLGCPAKKVCKRQAGSALLKNEPLVARLLSALVSAVHVPVTLKMRTGYSPLSRNGVRIAKLAETCGVAAITVHGRTRQCMFRGAAEYDTIAAIKSVVQIPVIANGDIDSAAKARSVLDYTKADGVMIGRGAQGQPWLFQQISNVLFSGVSKLALQFVDVRDIILDHLDSLYSFYGETTGVRIARKHLTWYCSRLEGSSAFRSRAVRAQSAAQQLTLAREFFDSGRAANQAGRGAQWQERVVKRNERAASRLESQISP